MIRKLISQLNKLWHIYPQNSLKKINIFLRWYRQFYEWQPVSVMGISIAGVLGLINLFVVVGLCFGWWSKYPFL